MLKKILCVTGIALCLFSCHEDKKEAAADVVLWKPYNDSAEVIANQDHEIERMRYKLIQSKVLDKNEVFRPLYAEVSKFDDEAYEALKPLVLEQDIPTLQSHIASGKLSYERLVLFYLFRMYRYELDNETTLNTILALNENVVTEARKCDAAVVVNPNEKRHPIFGMPILLKDNIGASGMKTSAGSIALMDNTTDDSFIAQRLKKNGALILGKVNLSEWAYFLCEGCPVGYSAVGGQTLNPYGRRVFETGGSSAGSGTSVAANYAVAAVGTETSGSILSPSSQNSVVGLKPTVGLLSRTGIVPISSTLDTPGPMTKNVTDNAILLSAMTGKDDTDSKSVAADIDYLKSVTESTSLKGKRFGAMVTLIKEDSIYKSTVQNMREAGAEIIEFTPPEVNMDGFLSILNVDMRNDLPKYIKTQVKNKQAVEIQSIEDAIVFNAADSLTRIPYGQSLFEGIMADSTTAEGLDKIKSTLEKNGRSFFDTALDEYNLDAILSINNYHAGYAAVAKYPALTVPMGYTIDGEPIGLTFIAKSFHEEKLLQLGKAFEEATHIRRMPSRYSN
ncbi:amidase [Pricia antarctica]|uniref:Amidase n=1 Tax=Pricia antarctica TaxID=641691 RepID=A0A1G7DFY4_9FLAO|nr:amidase family protein [Pricia antarctica]SDE50433.1 amidase [Pricia antarctica]